MDTARGLGDVSYMGALTQVERGVGENQIQKP